MKTAILLIVLALSVTACGSNGFDVMQTIQSDALSSCTECASDLVKAQTQSKENASVEKMFETYGVELPKE